MNASYAADGYARLNGMGAVAVTNAVGAPGAINGIAGACAQHLPVILIAGSIPLRPTGAPFGGFNAIGIGHELGRQGMHELTETHVMAVPAGARPEPDQICAHVCGRGCCLGGMSEVARQG